jgi:predicted NBD/HSP70 family sugar kinase
MTAAGYVSGREQWSLPDPEPLTSGATSSEPSAAAPGDSQFGQVLKAIGAEIDRGERLLHGVVAGAGDFDAAQLIALQAGIYRWGEVVDLAAKLVDRAGSAVRVTLQNGNG